MSSYLEYFLFIGILGCLWGAWRLRANTLDDLNQGRRSSDRNYRHASWALLGIAGISALTLLITE